MVDLLRGGWAVHRSSSNNRQLSIIDGDLYYGGMPKQLPLLESPALVSGLCCAPLVSAPLSIDEATELAVRLKALSDPTRLRMLSLMMANPNLEACTCDL